MKKYLILTQSYNENCGGYIALHKLCDQINRVGGSAYLFPFINGFEFGSKSLIIPILKFCKERLNRVLPFKVNPNFLTPVLYSISEINNWNDWIVVYPEVVFGNPLGAKNVVRWFLHQPGHITGVIYYGKNELYFRYHSGIVPYESYFSKLSESELKIVHFPFEYYNELGVSDFREGTAYCLRKGSNKNIVHDLSDSILIDGKSHKEISDIFKRVKRFISYDTYTAYSGFAVLCGCESIVIPDEGVAEEEWLPNPVDRYGVSYGFANLEKSKLTAKLVFDRMQQEQERNLISTSIFIKETSIFFKS